MNENNFCIFFSIAVCGQRYNGNGPRGGPRILGGRPAQYDWPWHVQLFFQNEGFCGGAIIHDSWVLTAGHCVSARRARIQRTATALTVRYGSLNSNGGQSVGVRRVILHERYQGYEQYDIALLELQSPLRFTSNVGRVCLGTSNLNAGTYVTVTGFGYLGESGEKYCQI